MSKKILAFVLALVLVCSLVPAVSAAETEVRFDFGENGNAEHADGKDLAEGTSYTVDGYTLTLTGLSKVYGSAYDAKGNSCIKLGTSKVVGSFSFTVPEDINEVAIYAAKYKAKASKLSVNGTEYTLSGASDNGEYDEIIVDTSATKTVTVSTVTGALRAMVDAIVFRGTAGSGSTPSVPEATEPVETEPEVTEPATSDPAADSVLTIAEAIALGASKAHDTYTAGKYYVTGKITEVYSTTWGNMYITDEEGNTLTIYGTYSADGSTRYDALDVKPVAGDTVTVYGIVGQYKDAPQIKNGWITEHIPGEGQPEETTPEESTPSADPDYVTAPVAGTAYKFGMIQEKVSTTDVYYLKGGMSGYYMATSKNVADAIDVYLEETEGGYYLYTMSGDAKLYINMVVSGTHVNGAYENAASTVYTYDSEAGTVIAQVNDAPYWFGTRNDMTYTTVGPCATSYNGFYCKFYAADTEVEPTEPEETEPADPDGTVLTIVEAVAKGAAMEHDTYTNTKYKVTGVIVDVYNTQYGNMHIADENGNQLTIYGTYSADGSTRYDAMDVKPVAGDTVTIYGPVGQYKETPQIKNGWIVEHIPGETQPTDPTTPEETEPTEPSVPEDPEASNTATIDFSTAAQRIALSENAQVWQNAGVTLTNNKTADSNAIVDYSNPARFYKNSEIVIEAAGMTKIEFVSTTNIYAKAIESAIAAQGGCTVSRDQTTFVVTAVFEEPVDSYSFVLSSSQTRAMSLTVTMAAQESEEIKGDLNDDGVVTNDDVVVLLWNALFPEQYPINEDVDYNGDGTITNDDVVVLLWYALFPEQYPL